MVWWGMREIEHDPAYTVPVPGAIALRSGFLDVDAATNLAQHIVDETYAHARVQLRYLPGRRPFLDRDHLLVRHGDPGVTYTYKQKPKPIHPWTPALSALRRLVAAELAPWEPNTAVTNFYLSGSTSLYPHSDILYIPELGQTPIIASITLGATRTFELVQNAPALRPAARTRLRLPLAHGDLCVMHGRSQLDWRHGLPEAAHVTGVRISITFRHHMPV